MRRLSQAITWLHVTLSTWPTPRVNRAAPAVVCWGMSRPAGCRGAAAITAAATVAAVVGVLVAREPVPRASGQGRQPPAQAVAPPEAPPRWSAEERLDGLTAFGIAGLA